MTNDGAPDEVQEETPPRTSPCLTDLPNELLFSVMRFAIAVGREADASALARTSPSMHSRLNDELYKLVIKNKTFHILHWAVRRNQRATLRIALANGANPNEMWTSGSVRETRLNVFRPAGWGLNTAQKLDRAVRAQLRSIRPLPLPQTNVNWYYATFSSPRLSLRNSALVQSLWDHYSLTLAPVRATDYDTEVGNDDTRLDDISIPPEDDFTFGGNMSATDMDQRIAKISFLRLFRQWNHPLHIAALHNRTLLTAALLAHGADADSTCVQVCSCYRNDMPSSTRGCFHSNCLVTYTPLHVAICSGNYTTAKLLVARGAHRMAKVFSGNNDRAWLSENALHTALSYYPRGKGFEYDFIEFLLCHGFAARIEERNDENLTPLLIACNTVNDEQRDDVVKLLLYFGADKENQGPRPPRTKFSGPFPANSVELATPALWAARKGQFKLAKLLLDRGADVNTKSSVMRVTMLHAVCSRAGYDEAPQERIDFLDYLLARSTENDLNAFDAMGCTPLTMLLNWDFPTDPEPHVSVMESKLCRKGANIMAGRELGMETPFESFIQESLNSFRLVTYFGFGTHIMPCDVGNKVLAALRLFRINQHRQRPRAFLNQFWGYLNRALGAVPAPFVTPPPPDNKMELVACVLHALIKAGFSPAEVDSHDDTAMTSFLKFLLDNPILTDWDKNTYGNSGWLIQSIMALLQENGAALHLRNEEGHTAFDYLEEILEYDGDSPTRILLAKVVGRQVRLGLDIDGNMCFKFHPNQHLFGSLGGNSTLQGILDNSSRWLVCKHWCRHHCGISAVTNGHCGCARTPFQTFANCQGECCGHMIAFDGEDEVD